MSEICSFANQKHYPFHLPELPFADSALEPHMSSKTFSFHHKKHHNAYVVNLNKLIENSDLNKKSLEEIIQITHNDASKAGIFNNAAQVWNHSFFWHSMKADGGGKPNGELLKQINHDFGNFENFLTEFKTAATSQFGSGWAWLVINEYNKLEIMKTSNADLPMVHKKTALLTIDVWEHAYYLDYQNLRPNFVDVFLNHLVNWDFASRLFTHYMK